MVDDSAPQLRLVEEHAVWANDFIAVYNDDVVADAEGWTGRFLRIIERGGRPGAAVLAISGERIALVRVYRYALGMWEWGLPRGFAHGDDPADTARQELCEELGGEPDELVPLGVITPNSGLLASRVHVYLARYEEEVNKPQDPAEVSATRWVDLPTLTTEIADGLIVDAFTLSALTIAAARGLIRL